MDFAVIILLVTATLDAVQGLIALTRREYYQGLHKPTAVFTVHTWGWILVVWWFVVALVAVGLWLRWEPARWLAILVAVLNLIVELAFAGGHNYPLWALISNALCLVVIYAVTLRWEPAETA